jgi:hypothetical protein
MSQEQYKKIIERELRNINQRIDFKIIKGEQYAEESKKHKMLLQKIRRQKRKGFFGRLFARHTLQF